MTRLARPNPVTADRTGEGEYGVYDGATTDVIQRNKYILTLLGVNRSYQVTL